MKRIYTLVAGMSGIGIADVTNHLLTIDPTTISNALNIIAQIIISIATVWHMFKKNKSNS